MPIPDCQLLLLPVVRLVGDRLEQLLADVRQRIADDLSLTEFELAERLVDDSQIVFANRIAWSVQYLKSAAAIFYLLTKPEIALADKAAADVKKVAKSLLEKLKQEKLVLDWIKQQKTRAMVLTTIQDVLDQLRRRGTRRNCTSKRLT